jgi:hypothetical protein
MGSGSGNGLYYNGVQIVNDAVGFTFDGLYHLIQFEADIANGLGYLWRDSTYLGSGVMHIVDVAKFQLSVNVNTGTGAYYFDDVAYYSDVAAVVWKRKRKRGPLGN